MVRIGPNVPVERAVCGPYESEGRRVKVYQAERSLRTSGGLEIRDITEEVREFVAESGVMDGIACVYSPHTTCMVRQAEAFREKEHRERLTAELGAKAAAGRAARERVRDELDALRSGWQDKQAHAHAKELAVHDLQSRRDAVDQLSRYLERIREDAAKAGCRGLLAAQRIQPQAATLAAARGIACVEVDLEVLRGEREPDLTLFAV
jgi:thiamine phosphate synthase YjbQ (UPF0047 family)